MNHLFHVVDALALLVRQYSTLNLNGSFYTLVAHYTILKLTNIKDDFTHLIQDVK